MRFDRISVMLDRLAALSTAWAGSTPSRLHIRDRRSELLGTVQVVAKQNGVIGVTAWTARPHKMSRRARLACGP